MYLPIDISGLKSPIKSVDMHTCRQAIRIIYSGFPNVTGTLSQQFSLAKATHDHIRKQILLEPSGHSNMHAVILRPNTEMTATGKAHMGALVCDNEGFETESGNSMMALGRFLVDCHDEDLFGRRKDLCFDTESQTVNVIVHTQYGLVDITVPATEEGKYSDSSRPVSFISVPSFAVAYNEWYPSCLCPHPESNSHVDIAYGGDLCFLDLQTVDTSMVTACIDQGYGSWDMAIMSSNLEDVKLCVEGNYGGQRKYLVHPTLGHLRPFWLLQTRRGSYPRMLNSIGSEAGLCYFVDQVADRSSTAGAVAARVAAAYGKGERKLGESWTYHSLLQRYLKDDYLIGTPVEEVKVESNSGDIKDAVRVKIEGFAYYTGHSTFVVE